MQGEPICLGHSLQSGVRPVQRADSANHEGLAPLLWADGDPVRDGTAEDLRHSIVVFSRVEIQPGALGVLFQQTLAFQAATYTLADQLNQLLQLVFVRCLDALKAGRTIVATHVDAVFNDLPHDLDIASHRFLPNPLAVIASRHHPLAGRQGLKWKDLKDETFLMREEGSGTFNAVRRHLEKRGESLGKTMTIASNEAIKYAVVENMGISILSAYVLADSVGPDLVQLRLEGFPILSDWHVVYPKSKPMSLIAERFLEFVLKRGPDVLPMENLERQVERALAQGEPRVGLEDEDPSD